MYIEPENVSRFGGSAPSGGGGGGGGLVNRKMRERKRES